MFYFSKLEKYENIEGKIKSRRKGGGKGNRGQEFKEHEVVNKVVAEVLK